MWDQIKCLCPGLSNSIHLRFDHLPFEWSRRVRGCVCVCVCVLMLCQHVCMNHCQHTGRSFLRSFLRFWSAHFSNMSVVHRHISSDSSHHDSEVVVSVDDPFKKRFLVFSAVKFSSPESRGFTGHVLQKWLTISTSFLSTGSRHLEVCCCSGQTFSTALSFSCEGDVKCGQEKPTGMFSLLWPSGAGTILLQRIVGSRWWATAVKQPLSQIGSVWRVWGESARCLHQNTDVCCVNEIQPGVRRCSQGGGAGGGQGVKLTLIDEHWETTSHLLDLAQFVYKQISLSLSLGSCRITMINHNWFWLIIINCRDVQ